MKNSFRAPQTIKSLITNNTFGEQDMQDRADGKLPRKLQAVTVRLPATQVNNLEELAQALSVSRHELLTALIMDAVDELSKAKIA